MSALLSPNAHKFDHGLPNYRWSRTGGASMSARSVGDRYLLYAATGAGGARKKLCADHCPITLERKRLKNVATDQFERAIDVARAKLKTLAGDPIANRRDERPRPGVGPWSSSADDGVEIFDAVEKLGQRFKRELSIRVRQKDEIVTRRGESTADSCAVAAIGGMRYYPQARIPSAERPRDGLGAIGASIVDDDDFVSRRQLVQTGDRIGQG